MTVRRTFLALFAIAATLALTATFRGAPPASAGGVFVVEVQADSFVDGDGDCSLREAIYAARQNEVRIDCGADAGSAVALDTILLPGGPVAGKIYTMNPGNALNLGDFDLGGGPLLIQKSGPPGDLAAVDGGGAARAFQLPAGQTATLQGFIITDASSFSGGGGVDNEGNLTLTNMRIRNSDSADLGGGIYNGSNATLTLDGTVIINNTAATGGGIYNAADATLSLGNTTLIDNTAGTGAGIYNLGTLTTDDSTITGNIATSPPGGGGVRNFGTATFNTTEISDNQGASSGGGIYNEVAATLNLVDSTIAGNTNSTGGGIGNLGTLNMTGTSVINNTGTGVSGGGGIISGGPATIVRSTVAGNDTAGSGGGLNAQGDATVTIIDSTFSGNSSASRGAAIQNGLFSGSQVTTMNLTNVTISGNIGGQSAVQNYTGSTINFLNVTAVDNASTPSPNNPDFLSNTGGIVNLRSTIIDSNDGSPVLCGGAGIASQGYNLATVDDCSFGAAGDQVVADVMLGPLADNGGPTQTHAILPGSPAIDAGDVALCPSMDQRGEPRPQGNHCDVGAYESSFSATPSPTPDPLPTPTPTPLPTPGPSPTQTPLPTPEPPQLTQGDNDCDGDSDAVDALVSLQTTAGIDPNQQPNCPDIGAALPAGAGPDIFGDIDCDNDVDAVDALQILRNVAGLPVNQTAPCPAIGDAI